MKRQKLELSLTQFWSEEFRNELAASVQRPIRQPSDTFLWLLDFLTPAVSGSSRP